MPKIIRSNGAPAPIGPYSQAVLAGGALYCSGQLGIDPQTGEINGDVTAQTERAVANIGAVLTQAGMGFENVVKTTCFLASIDDYAAFNAVYEKYFVSKPARSCVAAALPR